MDRIRCSQSVEEIHFGGLKIGSPVFADDVVPSATAERDLWLSLERFTAECEGAGMRISSSKSETAVLSRKRVECLLWVRDEVLPQVEEFNYLGVLFTSEGKMELSRNVTDTHSSHGCPCKRKKSHTSRNSNHHTLHVSYSAVNITVVARNEAGKSPETVLHVPACHIMFISSPKPVLFPPSSSPLRRRTCLELYELQDADLNPESVIVLTARKQKKGEGIKSSMKNFTRYLYFEHRCHNGKPRTVKVCLFYLKEGAPNKEPQYDKTVPKTHSVSLSWKEISYEHHRGFLTHYSLCSMKISPQKEPKECFTISASMTEHHLENLTPGAKYNITLAGATRAGEGLLAAQIIETLQEKPVNGIRLRKPLILFNCLCFSLICCEVINSKYFIPHHPEKEQEMCNAKEEVHKLTLHQPVPEQTPVSDETSISSVLKGECNDTSDEDMKKERSDSAGSEDKGLSLDSADQTLCKPQMAELARLIYRNGLVVNVKSESS
uniref:Fibronectin type-III domain-containing protein n=1 Tax=Nothobranchius furzeri TaxID=105023 RepID=A0A8C6MF86_NOTFU